MQPKVNRKVLLNLGCGTRYHPEWINIDFIQTGRGVIAHDLLRGIPLGSNSCDVVYNSHLLEHFPPEDAVTFIRECHRVLKLRGVIRVAVPDLEEIVKNYQTYLLLAIKGNKKAEANYDWTMLELYDQFGRNYSEGQMGALYNKGDAINADFIYKRVGVKLSAPSKLQINLKLAIRKPRIFLTETLKQLIRIFRAVNIKLNIRELLLQMLLGKEFKYYKIGKFRLSGEPHQWMYDRFSLARLLRQAGFKETHVCNARSSSIAKWNSYYLDINKDGTVYKPDSIFIEAVK